MGELLEATRHEIVGLRRLLMKDSNSHRQKLNVVQKNIAEVKEQKSQGLGGVQLDIIHSQADVLERTVSSRGTTMSWMLICMLAAVIVIGGLMWNRMHYYE